MTRSLATRLTDLLDVIQAVDGGLRSDATWFVAGFCGVSPRYLTDLATRAVLPRRPIKLDFFALLDLEVMYRHQLTLWRAFKGACENVRRGA